MPGYGSLVVIALVGLAILGDLAFLYGLISDLLPGPGVGR
jgi:preprotein translocase subunit Sss1